MNTGTSASAVDYDPFSGGLLQQVVPTTESQREIWLGDRFGKEASLSFNLSESLRLRGPLDAAALCTALQRLVERHDALRASFGPDGETMCILEPGAFEVPLLELSQASGSGRDSAVAACIEEETRTPFALEQGGLFRAKLLRLDAGDHLLLLTAHHIICDGWSWSVIISELARLYASALDPRAPALPDPESFAAYALQQALSADSEEHLGDQAYWTSRFADRVPVLDLPTDRPRPALRSFSSACVVHRLDAGLVSAVRRVGARRGASLLATLLAAMSDLLSRLCDETSVVIGIPAAGQAAEGLAGLVGHCVNLLPLRFDVDGAESFDAAIQSSQRVLLDALDHQKYTFGTLLRHLAIPRDPSRMPLVSVVLNVEPALGDGAGRFPGLQLEVASNPRASDPFELFINAVHANGGLRMECQYNVDLFDRVTVASWLRAFESLLRSAVADSSAPRQTLSLLGPEALAELVSFQPKASPYERELRMHEAFERQCDATPERIAITSGSATLTYAALEQRANRIAHLLRSHGISRGELVGLAVDREPDMVAALLGILKAGAGYVPLDPNFPPDRLRYMTDDAGLAALVTHQAHVASFNVHDRPVLVLDRPQEALAEASAARIGRDADTALPESIAYVIYTSGSTGRPKGVQVPHRSVSNFLQAMAPLVGIGRDDRLVAVTTLSFDIAVLELMLPLSTGAMVVLASRDAAGDGAALSHLLARSRATLMQATPSTWRLLLEAGWRGKEGFRTLCGGESLPSDLAAQLVEYGGLVLNLYGPTETTVWSTCAAIHAEPAGPPRVDIGRPIANTRVWILDANAQLLPPGMPGEIAIGGEGVTLGYLRRPELTADRFIADRFIDAPFTAPLEDAPAPWLYRTGDRGRWTPGGRLEHLGRLDAQVKLRGFRIELGEIEAQAMAFGSISRAVATVREVRPGDARLLLYVVCPERELDPQAVLHSLRRSLPDYMIPQQVIALEEVPLLPNGKVDRRSLPMPEAVSSAAGQPPRNELERQLAETMATLLGLPAIGIHDDFFASGGHSLLAAQFIARINRQLGCSLPWRALFDAPTVARLAQGIDATPACETESAKARIPRRKDQAWAPLTAAQDRLHQLEQFNPGRITYNIPSAHRFQGPLDLAALDHAFRALAQRQSVLRTIFTERDGRIMQQVLESPPAGLPPVIDLGDLPSSEREPELLRRMDQLSETSFDLAAAPPFRAALFRLSEHSHVLFFMAHHIAWDGWSFHLMNDELAELYAAHREGRKPDLPALPVTFGDYAAWHNDWLQGPGYAAQREFWRQRLAGSNSAPALPRDMPGTPGMAGHGSTLPLLIPRDTVEALRGHALRQESTLFMTLLAAYFVALHRASGYTDLTIGTPVRGRNNADVEHLMGFFTTLLPLRIQLERGWSFTELLRHVRAVLVDSLAHPDILLEDLHVSPVGQRGHGSHSLYHALLSYQDGRRREQPWGELTRERIAVFPRGTAEDLGLWFLEDESGLWGELLYNDEAFHASTATRLQLDLLAVLGRVAENPNATIESLARAAEEERRHADEASAPLHTPVSPAAAGGNGQLAGVDGGESVAGLRDPREELLAGIFTELFGIRDIGPGDSFFELGGSSLLALRLVKRVEETTGVRLTLIRLATGTVGSIARELPERHEPRESATRGFGARWRNFFVRSTPRQDGR